MRRKNTATITCTINSRRKTFKVPPMIRLLDLIRDRAKLTGTKEGCAEGECGACAVIMNGELVNSCLVPALQADGANIITIEGVAKGRQLHAIQEAMIEHGGAQCGICTPGMIMAAYVLLKKYPQPTRAQIAEGLAGNLCRCTGYTKIAEAVVAASKRARITNE